MHETLTDAEIDIVNPINLQKLYSIKETSDEEVSMIFSKAENVGKKIAALSLEQRIKEIHKLRNYIIENRDMILTRIVEETGKSRMDALTSELFEVGDVIDYYSSASKKILANETIHTPIVLMGKKSKVFYEPLGTILIITPWNYPFYQCIVPSVLAFITGNAIIVKPSEHTPLKGLVEEIVEKSGFMKDAIQIAYGTGLTGKKLIDARPDKIHFTGSSNTGKKIMAHAAQQLIPVDLELGGKDPSIVFEDVNIERTVNGVMWGGLTNAGQSCTSIERLYVQEKIYDEFISTLTDRVKKLKMSSPERAYKTSEDCDVGAMTTEFQVKKVEEHIADAVAKGAKILCGGKRPTGTRHFEPTVISDVNHSMLIMTEETFGPVIPVMKFKSEEEAVKLANDSIYGLSASVWSKDMKRCERVARKIKTGNVSINSHMLTEGNPALPFGGTKQSGFGRLKGRWGLESFSNIKAVIIDVQSKKIEPHWYPFTASKYKLMSDLILNFFYKSKNWLKFAMVGLTLDNIGNKEKIK
jgi:acyl-CoA reductase-like NAD-dependent aldehyde dehydrogenase